MNYDFTSSGLQAYGSNMKLKVSRYCLYSGECNRDGIIDLGDLLLINNDAGIFKSGNVVTDTDGNKNVDLNDLLIAYNNSAMFVQAVLP